MATIRGRRDIPPSWRADGKEASDQLAHWIAIALYAAIAVLTIPALNALRVEAVLLTVLVLLGVHLALRLMFATGAPSSGAEPGSSALAGDGRPVTFSRGSPVDATDWLP